VRHLTGLYDLPSPPGLLITPLNPDLAERVRAIQGATAAYWKTYSLAEAIERIDEEPPSLAVAGPPDPAEVPALIKALRGLWERRLVPLVVVLPAGHEGVVVDAYANGVDFVVTPDVPDDIMRARAKGLLRLRTLTALLADSRERAKKRLETQSESFRFLLEDIRDPLSVLAAGLADLESTAGLQDEDKALCQLLAHEARRVSSTAADLIDLQELQGGQNFPRRERFDPRAVVEGVVGRLRGVALARKVKVKLAVGAAPMVADAAPALYERVVENLLSNALRYAPEGDTVEVELVHAGRTISLAVSNGGPPIPPEMRDRIFDPYVRLSGDVPPGAGGLGLAFCRAVMNAHGGNVHVTERNGRTRFVASLPR
jgi:signal transduction histidine kinase